MKEQEADGLLSILGIKTPLSKIPLLNILLYLICYKTNQIVNKFSLTEDKFTTEMHLRQSVFTFMACELFTRNNKEFKTLCRQEIQIISTEMDWKKLVLNMTWLMANTKTSKEEHSQVKS